MWSLLIIICVFVVLLGAGQLITLISFIKAKNRSGFFGTHFNNHSVIIGWDETARYVAEQLIGVGKEIAIVTDKEDDVRLIRNRFKSANVFVLLNDYDHLNPLKKVNIEGANSVFVNLEGDTRKLAYCHQLKEAFSLRNVIVTLENAALKETFSDAGISNTISSKEITSKLLSSYLFEPDVASFSASLLSYAKSGKDYDIKQLLVTGRNPYNGTKYQDAFFDLKKRYNCVLIGITKHDKYGQKKLIKNPHGEMRIDAGNYLVIILNGHAFNLLKPVFKVNEGIDISHRVQGSNKVGFLRRMS